MKSEVVWGPNEVPRASKTARARHGSHARFGRGAIAFAKMTHCGHDSIGMDVRIAALKARLSSILRRVQAGESVVIFDRARPIARLIAHAPGVVLSIRGPVEGAPTPGEVPLPRARKLRRDVSAYLAEERQSHR